MKLKVKLRVRSKLTQDFHSLLQCFGFSSIKLMFFGKESILRSLTECKRRFLLVQ